MYDVDTEKWKQEPTILIQNNKTPYQLERYDKTRHYHSIILEQFKSKLGECLTSATDEGVSLEIVEGGMLGSVVVATKGGSIVLAPAYCPTEENSNSLDKYTIRSLTAMLQTVERVEQNA